jgi:hypothetical protein
MKNKSIFVQKEITLTLNGITFKVEDNLPNQSLNDDDVYQNDELWIKYPRGCCNVYTLEENGDHTLIHQLRGIRKFGDQTDSFGPQNKPLINNKLQKQVIATVKENGECFHVSFFEYRGILYCIIGSKNVHILLDCNSKVNSIKQQLDKISENQGTRVTYAVKMASYFFQIVYNSKLSDYIVETGVTFVGEYINPNHQHVVKYTTESINFFAITHPECIFTYYHPLQSFKLFEELGCKCVKYIECNTEEELTSVKDKYFHLTNSEGLVLYFIDECDTTVNMFKYKNKQYTILRTIREYYNSSKSTSFLIKRLKEYHIPLTTNEVSDYTTFYNWLKQKTNISHFSTELYNQYSNDGKIVKPSSKIIIFLIGVPGSGKTTVGSQLVYYFNNTCKIPTVYTDQDLNYGDSKKLDVQLKEYVTGEEYQIIILGKSNTSTFSRELSLKHVTTESLFFVTFTPPKNDTEKNMFVSRIAQRPFHYNLFSNKAKEVVNKFCNDYEEVKDEELIGLNSKELIHLSIESDIISKCNTIINSVLKNSEQMNQINNFIWCNYIGISISFGELKRCIDLYSKKYSSLNLFTNYFTKSPHITCIHSKQFHSNTDLALYWSNMVNKSVSFYIDKIAWTTNSSAFFISFLNEEDKIINKYPHISWQKKDNTIEPYTSNFILETKDYCEEILTTDDNTKIICKGIVKRF